MVASEILEGITARIGTARRGWGPGEMVWTLTLRLCGQVVWL